jgi:DNA-binding CsgD family transcriptional regulator
MREVGNRRDLPIGLTDLTEIALRKGDRETARRRIAKALAIVEDTGDSYTRANVLQVLARLERSDGHLADATAAVRRALGIWCEFGNVPAFADCLDLLAEIAIAAGEMTTAARMIGAADGVRGRCGQRRVESFPDEHRHRLASIAGALGEADDRRAWEGGQALSVDEAIAEGLAWEPSAGALPEVSIAAVAPSAGSVLTPRELDVLRLMTEGLTNQQAADRLFISRRTATSHVSSILAKLDLPSRTAAVAWAVRNGID